VTGQISHDELMRYLDGEASPEERARIESEAAGSTELSRDLTVFRMMKEDLMGLQFSPELRRVSVWDSVHSQLTRPIGWILLVIGTAVWVGYGAYLYAVSDGEPFEKMATGAIVIGILLLLVSVIWEQYRAWLTDPYKDIQR
jgi:ABC-type antimicrobial peptide transport system permease subunit